MTDKRTAARPRTFLGRLARDTGGNTLAILGMALIPISAMAGAGIDTARLYVAKVRLQQACDAGVLAGRKFMTSSNDPTLDPEAATRAREFFDNNFPRNWLKAHDQQFTPTKTADQQVAGTAQVTVPMTIMKMFPATANEVVLQVKCEARFDVADADIMFVLDTTGSMACKPEDGANSCGASTSTYTRSDGSEGYYTVEKSGSKLQATRNAVLEFEQTMKNNADPTTNIRYGFVTYASSTNVGRAISEVSPGYLSDKWTYQSRHLYSEDNSGSRFDVTLTRHPTTNVALNAANCSTVSGRYPSGEPDERAGWYTNSTAYRLDNVAWANGSCVAKRQNLIPRWRYEATEHDVSQYKLFSTTVMDPTRLDQRNSPKWQGCIEERETIASSTFDVDSLPADLNPDLVPNDDDTRWHPMWPSVEWERDNNTTRYDTSANVESWNFQSDSKRSQGYVVCGAPAKRLEDTKDKPNAIRDYMYGQDMRPMGGTYHDVGMIWGVRLLSPKGIFKNDTAAHPGRNAPNRHLILLTDGYMAPNWDSYGQYGVEQYDRRVTGGNSSVQTARHNARFVAECSYAKDKLNITVWVVALGVSLTPELKSCASPDSGTGAHAFATSSGQGLSDIFKQIAEQTAMLRVSK